MRAIASFMATMAAVGAPDRIRVKIDTPAPSATTSTLTLAAPPNAIVSGRLALFNAGAEGNVLHWEAMPSATACATPRPARWLEIEPASGSLEGGHSASMAVYASSFAASTSVRRGFLCIRSEAIVEPLVEVPVALTVEGPAAKGP
jgi:hypothetical protein